MLEAPKLDLDRKLAEIGADQLFAARGKLKIVHHVPGRVRMRISLNSLQSLGEMPLDIVRNFIEGIAGVHGLRVSRAALSAVIEYDPEILAPQIWDDLFDDSTEVSQLAFATLAKAAGSERGEER